MSTKCIFLLLSLFAHFLLLARGSGLLLCEGNVPLTFSADESVSEKEIAERIATASHNSSFPGEPEDSNKLLYLVTDSHAQTSLGLISEEYFGLFIMFSQLYFSSDYAKSYAAVVDNGFKNATFDTSVVLQSPLNLKKVLLTAFIDHLQYFVISVDGGYTFKHVRLNEMASFTKSDVSFHPSIENMLLIVDKYSHLWISFDFAMTWYASQAQCQKVAWSDKKEDAGGVIFCLQTAPTSPESEISETHPYSYDSDNSHFPRQKLMRSDDFGKTWHLIAKNVISFTSVNNFLCISFYKDLQKDRSMISHHENKPKETAPSEEAEERFMAVSKDSGQTFKTVHAEGISHAQFFAILGKTEDMLFIHIDSYEDNSFGTLYSTDTTGILLTPILERHLYTRSSLSDFYQVASLRGVFITSVVTEKREVTTQISYNRGASWDYIKEPENGHCIDGDLKCTLHIHYALSKSKGTFFPEGPLSYPEAPGFIISHGHVGDSLHTRDPDVYITIDGGYNWRKVLDGPHHYEVLNYGSIIVAAPSYRKHEYQSLKFSLDYGKTWGCLNFSDTKYYINKIKGSPKSKIITIIGTKNNESTWSVFTLKFKDVITRTCSVDDFETWLTHKEVGSSQEGCVLGTKEYLRRKKPGRWCLISDQENLEKIVSSETCACTMYDYDCEFGFMRNGNTGKCELEKSLSNDTFNICVHNHLEKLVTSGYRKVTGNTCEGGFIPEQHTHLIDINTICDGVTVETDNLDVDNSINPDNKAASRTSRSKKIYRILLVLILLFVIAGFIAFYFYTKRKPKNISFSQFQNSTEAIPSNTINPPSYRTTSAVNNDKTSISMPANKNILT